MPTETEPKNARLILAENDERQNRPAVKTHYLELDLLHSPYEVHVTHSTKKTVIVLAAGDGEQATISVAEDGEIAFIRR